VLPVGGGGGLTGGGCWRQMDGKHAGCWSIDKRMLLVVGFYC